VYSWRNNIKIWC